MGSSYILTGRGKHNFQGAFQKYGIQNFQKDILIRGEFSQSEINCLEKQYIREAKSIGKAEYNITEGGDGRKTVPVPWNKGKPVPDEIKKKISDTNKQYSKEKHSQWGTHRSEETKKKISSAGKGRTPWNKGKSNCFSEDHILKMKENIRKMFKEKLGGGPNTGKKHPSLQG